MQILQRLIGPRHEVSNYNTLVECDDGWLLHSQMKGTLLLLNQEKADLYRQFAAGKSVPRRFVETLRKAGCLKAFGFDERQTIGEFWDKNVNSALGKSLTIVTTDRCNLGCTYCYETKSEWRMMGLDVQKQLEKFIEVYLTATPTKSLGITWFGGEPTLNMSCIENLTAFIDPLCKKLGIMWSPYIITNGTTLTEHVIDRLIACKLTSLQITVDGLKEDHDAKRPYLAEMSVDQMNEHQIAQRQKIQPAFLPILGQQPKEAPVRSSFDDIMRNIKFCYDKGLSVSLRINVDHINKDRVEQMYQMIYDKGWMQPNEKGGVVRPYTHAIFDGCGGSKSSQMNKEEHAELELKLSGLAQRKSNEAYRHSLSFTGDTCTANKKFQFVVNPSGALIKCWHHATDDSHGIGFITNLDFATKGAGQNDRYEFNPLKDPECYDCHVLPMCMGGCKANNRFIEDGYQGNHNVGCVAARWVLPDEIRQLYELSKKAPK